MQQSLRGVLRGEFSCSRHLCAAVQTIDRLTDVAMLVDQFVPLAVRHNVCGGLHDFFNDAHCADPLSAVSSESTRAMVRFASSILKPLCFSGFAGASSTAAA